MSNEEHKKSKQQIVLKAGIGDLYIGKCNILTKKEIERADTESSFGMLDKITNIGDGVLDEYETNDCLTYEVKHENQESKKNT